jgi:hypothetical protein
MQIRKKWLSQLKSLLNNYQDSETLNVAFAEIL